MAEPSSNVLVIAPHPDDESIGCGGTICDHVARGDRVSAVFLTSGELGIKGKSKEDAWGIREGEARAAATVLGLAGVTFLRQPDWFLGDAVADAARALAEPLRRLPPSRVFVPHPNEWHPDHQASLPILREAMRLADLAPCEVLAYEVWTPLSTYDHTQDVAPFMRTKLAAVRCHRSQLSGFRYDRAVQGLNRFRGELAGRCRYAEVFASLQLGADVKSPVVLAP